MAKIVIVVILTSATILVVMHTLVDTLNTMHNVLRVLAAPKTANSYLPACYVGTLKKTIDLTAIQHRRAIYPIIATDRIQYVWTATKKI